MMQDPMVKERMKRMLSKMGGDSTLSGVADDDEALDRIFEQMQDPKVLERLSEMTKNEAFQEKMSKMTQDPNFMQAAGEYADEMKQEVLAAAEGGADEGGLGLGLDDDDGLDDDEDIE